MSACPVVAIVKIDVKHPWHSGCGCDRREVPKPTIERAFNGEENPLFDAPGRHAGDEFVQDIGLLVLRAVRDAARGRRRIVPQRGETFRM